MNWSYYAGRIVSILDFAYPTCKWFFQFIYNDRLIAYLDEFIFDILESGTCLLK